MTAFDDWRTAGLVEVRLPSGFHVRGVIPTAELVLRRGLAPLDARDAAVAREGASPQPVPDTTSAPGRGRLELYAVAMAMAATFPREVWDEASSAWQPIPPLSAEDLDRGTWDPRDVGALVRLVTRRATAEQITAQSEEDEASAWAGFRRDGGGDGGGLDGDALRESPERDAPDPGAGARARRGRSDRVPPAPGGAAGAGLDEAANAERVA